jgi:selenocysteine-specific elongation factor
LFFAGLRDWQPRELAPAAGIDAGDTVTDQLRASGELCEVPVSPTHTWRLHRRTLERLGERIENTLGRLHEQNPLRLVIDRSALAANFQYLGSEALFAAALRDLSAKGRVQVTARGVTLAGHGPKLSHQEQKLLVWLVERIRLGGFQPPSVRECQQEAAHHQQSVPQLLALAAANGDLVGISADYYLHATIESQARETLASRLAPDTGLTVSEIREILNTSRKYALPYCEYLDQIGFTVRQGDVRKLKFRDS